MKVIRMVLGETEVARITDGVFEDLLKSKHEFAPNFQNWYDDCFYGIKGAKEFEARFEYVKIGNYFCFSKPSLKLIAQEIE